jgi:hypothetical protein
MAVSAGDASSTGAISLCQAASNGAAPVRHEMHHVAMAILLYKIPLVQPKTSSMLLFEE